MAAYMGEREMSGTSAEPAEPEACPATPADPALVAADWKALVDNVGPFAPLSALREYLERAPVEARSLPEYQWLKGFVAGREMHEEFAGTDVTSPP